MNRALSEYKSAVLIGLGAMNADILYLSLILLGLTALFNQPLIWDLLGMLGSVFLLYLAYLIFKSRNTTLNENKEKQISKTSITFYLQGFLLTFINPYTVAFWLSIAGYTTHKNLSPFITILGTICAIFLWITLMPYFVHRSKHRITQRTAYYFNLFSSVLLLGFGLSLALSLLNR
jgi:L-lysine exporter family protein LysE/ArgO